LCGEDYERKAGDAPKEELGGGKKEEVRMVNACGLHLCFVINADKQR